MAEQLSNELILFGFTNIVDKNRKDFRNLLFSSNDIKDLLEYQKEFQEFYSHLPTKKESGGFSTERGVLFYDTRLKTLEEREKQDVRDYPGGHKQIILDCKAKKKWMLKMLNERIETSLNSPSNLSDFGEWNNLENPQFFILKNKGILSCLFTHFDNINREEFPLDKNVYEKLVKVLFKSDGSKYSIGTFKKTKERYSDDNQMKKDQIVLCNNKNLTQRRCVHFLDYILSYEVSKS